MALACRTNTADRLSELSVKNVRRRLFNDGHRASQSHSSSNNVKLNDIITSILRDRRARCGSADVRCRPRLPILYVFTVDEKTSKKIRIDVAYLQDYSDRLKALRELISIQFRGKLSDVYHRLDFNGTGMIPVSDLDDGLRCLGICWQQVTGLTRVELHDLLDPEKSGSVDILDFLGIDSIPVLPSWSSLSLLDQWENYCAKVTESLLLDKSPPPIRHTRPTSVFPHPSDDYIKSSIHKIEACLRDYNENRRGIAKLRVEFQNVTEAEEKRAEQQRSREEVEARKRKIQAEAGMALLGDGGHRKSIFKSSEVLRGFEKPTPEELVNFFSTQNPTLLTNEEIRYRKFLKRIRVPLSRGDKIRTTFLKSAGSLDEMKFNSVLKELEPETNVQGYWTSFNVFKAANSKSSSDLFTFIEWFIKNF